jgi:hypothetical protein
MNELNKIISLYKTRYEFTEYYNIISDLLSKNVLFSKSKSAIKNKKNNSLIECEKGDIRVDLPISIGPKNAKYRIAILGLEPRDSNPKYNVEHLGKYVFGTPFGIEFWTEKNKYYRCFEELLKRNDCYLYFTDVVKEYEVKSSKGEADLNARKTFWKKAADIENISFLKKELEILNPTQIIALGNDTYSFLHQQFGDKVIKVVHPNARQNMKTKENSWDIARKQIQNLF